MTNYWCMMCSYCLNMWLTVEYWVEFSDTREVYEKRASNGSFRQNDIRSHI
jgi:hypothetical protein